VDVRYGDLVLDGTMRILDATTYNWVATCNTYAVAIDIFHQTQTEQQHTGVFTNDVASVRTQCLTWTSPITTRTLGHQPDPLIQGKTLQGLISGRQLLSEDPAKSLGNCSFCHYKGSGHHYSPDVSRFPSRYLPNHNAPLVDPYAVIGDASWAPPYGGSGPDFYNWTAAFQRAMPYGSLKPASLREALQKWVDDGAY